MSHTRANLLMLLASFIWGTAFVSQTTGMGAIGPFTFSFARFFFALLTVLPLAIYFERHNIKKIFSSNKLLLLCCATGFALFPPLILTMWNVQNPNTGEFTQAGWALWPIFGASNQMLAALTLMVLILYFFLRKKPVLPSVLPFLFITAITLTVLILKIQAFWGTNKPLAIISIVLFVFVLWMMGEGCVAFKHSKRHKISETKC
mgnify:FL=1